MTNENAVLRSTVCDTGVHSMCLIKTCQCGCHVPDPSQVVQTNTGRMYNLPQPISNVPTPPPRRIGDRNPHQAPARVDETRVANALFNYGWSTNMRPSGAQVRAFVVQCPDHEAVQQVLEDLLDAAGDGTRCFEHGHDRRIEALNNAVAVAQRDLLDVHTKKHLVPRRPGT